MRLKLVIILTMALGYTAYGQSTWNWPEDEEMKSLAEEKNVMYNDARKAGSFESAAAELDWLLENTPDLNASLYINGIKIYKELEKSAEGDAKIAYQEKVMELYDLRIQYFNREADVLDRKAYDAYKYYKDDKTKYAELFQLFEKTYELNGNDIGSQNLVAYMDVLRRYKLAGGEISDDDILDRYAKVTAIINYKIASGADEAKMERTKAFVDRMLTSMVTVDCYFIENSLGPKLTESPGDVKMAKKIMGLSITAQCTDSELFFVAAMVVQENEPEYGLAKIIAKRFAANENYEEAEKYYTQAIEITGDGVKKADIYFELGLQYTKRGMKSSARTHFYETVKADPTRTKSYKMIGDLYMTSYKDCKRDESKVEDRAVFIAAYNMYRKAGDQRSMANAQAQFPSMEDIFSENHNEGDTFKVGCWINESVKLQRRTES